MTAKPTTPGSAPPAPTRRPPRHRPPMVECLERRVLLSVAEVSPILHASSSLVGPGMSLVAEPQVFHPEGWAIDQVTISGPPPRANVPVAMSELSPPAVTPAVFDLPNFGNIEIQGMLGWADRLQIYKVPVAPETSTLQVEIQVPATSAAMAERLWLLNGAGDVLGHWPIAGPGSSIKVTVHAADESSGDGLMVGISRDDLGPNAAPAESSNYQLRISRDSNLDASDTPAESRGDHNGSSTSVVAVIEVGSGLSEPTASSTNIPGPLPALSTSASAGVLADGRATPRVGKLDGVVVDLSLIDLAAPSIPGERINDDLPGLESFTREGGLPMLAMSRPSERVMNAEVAGLVPSGLITMPLQVTKTDALERSSQEPSSKRPPLIVGFTLAAALTFGLLLPDLVATMTPVSPRRPSPLRPRGTRRFHEDDLRDE